MTRFIRKYYFYLIPLCLAFMARFLLFLSWLDSPFRHYGKIQGLDMKTHITYAKLFINGDVHFSVYRFFCGFFSVLSPDNFTVWIILLQLVTGGLVSFMAVYVSLMLAYSKNSAMLCGILCALYSTAMSYECFILPESLFVFFCFLSLASFFYFRKKRSRTALFCSGFLFCLPFLSRLSGIVWSLFSLSFFSVYRFWKEARSGLIFGDRLLYWFPFFGFSVLLMIVSGYNMITGHSFIPLPAVPNLPYIISAGNTMNIQAPEISGQTSALHDSNVGKIRKHLYNLFEKLIMVFHHREIPNNINCYFVSELLFPVMWTLKSRMILPVSVLGILVLLYECKLFSRFSVLFGYLVSLTLPMLVFIPLARYRLVLYPVLCIFAVYPMVFLEKKLVGVYRRYLPSLALFLLITLATGVTSDYKYSTLRSSDLISYASGMEESGYDDLSVERVYREALMLNADIQSAIYLSSFLMKKNDFSGAVVVLKNFYGENPKNKILAVNYASALLGSGNPVEAEAVLNTAGVPEDNSSKTKYFYQLGESFRMQGKKNQALETFQKAMEYSSDELERAIILKAIQGI